MHYSGYKPTRESLLSILNENQQNLYDLTNLKESGDGDIVKGIARTMLSLTKEVIGAGTEIFDIIVDGATKLTNDSVKMVSSLGQDVVEIFYPIGGI